MNYKKFIMPLFASIAFQLENKMIAYNIPNQTGNDGKCFLKKKYFAFLGHFVAH